MALALLCGITLNQTTAQIAVPTRNSELWDLNSPRLKGDILSFPDDSRSLVKDLRADNSGLIAPLLKRADFHRLNNEFQPAEKGYLDCLSILEVQAGVFDQALIGPLTQLGNLYQDKGRFQDAVKIFQRAKHISHRNGGLYNLGQVDVVEALSEVYLELNRFDAAEREQWYRFYIFEHYWDKSTAALLPVIFKLADWYRRADELGYEQYIYEETISTLETATRQSHVDLVTSLRAFATNYRLHGIADKQGLKALERALEISERNLEATPFQYAEVLIDLGDWYVIVAELGKAQIFYERAWRFLESKGRTNEQLQSLFKEPTALNNRNLNTRHPSGIRLRPNYAMQFFHGVAVPWHFPNQAEKFQNDPPESKVVLNAIGYIDVQLNVKEDGAVENVVSHDTELPPQFKETILHNLSGLLFRPRLVNGKPVAANEIKSRLTFIKD